MRVWYGACWLQCIATRTECIVPVIPLKNDLHTYSDTSRYSRQYICRERQIYFTLFNHKLQKQAGKQIDTIVPACE